MSFFNDLNEQSFKIHYRVLISRYRAYTTCRTCKGSRIRRDAAYVKINDHNIVQLLSMNLWKLQDFFKNINLTDHEKKVAKRILIEINNRLEFMKSVWAWAISPWHERLILCLVVRPSVSISHVLLVAISPIPYIFWMSLLLDFIREIHCS